MRSVHEERRALKLALRVPGAEPEMPEHVTLVREDVFEVLRFHDVLGGATKIPGGPLTAGRLQGKIRDAAEDLFRVVQNETPR
jgi:hypothetical protein